MLPKSEFVFITLMLLCFLSSCQDEPIYIFSKGKIKCITIFDKGNEIFIFASEVHKLEKSPSLGYAQFNVKGISELEKTLFVCWENGDDKLEILFPKAYLMKNTLPNDKCKILTEYATDEDGVPVVLKYHQEGCFDYDFLSGKIFPKGNAIPLE